jgi:hypothetical protein
MELLLSALCRSNSAEDLGEIGAGSAYLVSEALVAGQLLLLLLLTVVLAYRVSVTLAKSKLSRLELDFE